jgi:hypothetical protein
MVETSNGSARQYSSFSQAEFEQKLGSLANFSQADHSGTELAYDIPLPVDSLSVRVFSTLQDGEARSCGSDAIRCVVWDHELEQPVGGRKKTLRIQTWWKNLSGKIEDLVLNWRDYSRSCPDCGSRLVLRDGKHGEFFGCSSYPDCYHTEDV